MKGLNLALALASQQNGVIAGWQCHGFGMEPGDIKRLCRSGRWARLYRGVYQVNSDVAGEPSPRALTRAGLLSVGPHAVAVLDTAAAIHGIAGLTHGRAIHVSLAGRHARPRRIVDRGLILHQFVIEPADVLTVDGVAVTSPTRTVADLILRLDRYSAVSVMDSALNSALIDEDGLAMVAELIRGRRGAARARDWIVEADPRAESPLETRVRLRCVDGRVAPDTLQHEVYDRNGRLLGIGDLAWLSAKVVGEADGAEVHSQPHAVYRDRIRQNGFANAGWTIIRFTWQDTLQPGYIPHVVRNALARASAA